MDAAEADRDGGESRMLAARQLLLEGRTKITSMEWPPPNPCWWPVVLTRVLNAAVAKHSVTADELRNELNEHAALIGKPAPGWDLSDLQGGRHALKDLAGKVVVLDFWYRGCGWCMRAMPDMKGLAEKYRRAPVAFFAVNTDSKPADAKYVADFFALPYPTLLAGADQPALQNAAIAQQYRVQVFPTVIVIGPDGRVRAIEVGYHRTLRERLSKEIDALVRPAP
jgi:thiol-disulfide isomerase/thioredoxin